MVRRNALDSKLIFKLSGIQLWDNIKVDETPEPFQTNAFTFIFGLRGRLQADIDDRQTTIGEHEVLLLPANIVLSNIKLSAGFECRTLSITASALQSLLYSHADVWNEVVYIRHKYTFRIANEDKEFFNTLLDSARHIATDTRHIRYREETYHGLLTCFAIRITGILEDYLAEEAIPMPNQTTYFKQFLNLLREEPKKYRPVSYYAEKLCITPKYLTILCQRDSCKSAGEWIREYVKEDIRFYLKTSDLSVKEIGARIGFQNTSYFGKFCKELFGVPPSAYRKRRGQHNSF